MTEPYRTYRGGILSRLGLSETPLEPAGDPELPAAMHPIEFSQLEAVLETLAPRRVVEWGSGGSTRAFPLRFPCIERWVSVEHNRAWHERVRSKVDDPRVVLELRLPVASDPEPEMFDSAGGPTRPDYVQWAQRCEDDASILAAYVECAREHFDTVDLAFVDGRARRHCIALGFSLLREGGMLVVHDAQRDIYRDALTRLGPTPRWLDPWVAGQVCLVKKS
jgi:hypothetical protein